MKKITLFLSLILCVVFVNAQVLLVENFDYPVGTELTTQGWNITGNNADPTIKVTASSITYPGYIASGIGNEVTLTTGQDLNKTFTPKTSGNVYVSFLVNVTEVKADKEDYFIHLGAENIGTSYYGRVHVKKDANSKLAFGILLTSGGTPVATYSGFDYDLNTTYLIVLKYVIAGDASSAAIIVNPDMNGQEPATWITNNSGTTAKPANIGSVALRQGSPSSAPTVKVDGIRVTTSWESLFKENGSGFDNHEYSKPLFYIQGSNLMVDNLPYGTIVEIYNALGAKVQTSYVEGSTVELNNSLSKGVYIIKAGNYTQKIMF